MHKLLSLFAALVLFGALVPLGTTPAEAQDGPASDFVQSLSEDLMAIAQSDGLTPEDRDAQIRTLLKDGFDLPEIARFVIGRFWGTASTPQREEYMVLFADYLVGTYSRLLQQVEVSDFTITSTDRLESHDIVVHTRFELGGAFPISWSWRLRSDGAVYRIVDLTSNGVSMAVTYRSEFSAVVASQGFDALLNSLRRRSQAATAEYHGRVSMLPLVASLGRSADMLALRMWN